jgi:hypothetical protein
MQHLYWKQITSLCLFFCLAGNLQAQKSTMNQQDHDYETYWFGMSYGYAFSYNDYKRGAAFLPGRPTIGQVTSIYYNTNPIIQLGLSGTLRLKKKLLVRTNPTVFIGAKDINKFTVLKTTGEKLDYVVTPSTVLHLPLSLKLESDRYNFMNQQNLMRHYVFSGVKYDYDFSSGAINYGSSINTASPNIYRNTNLGYEVGFGVSFFLKYATVSPEIKFSKGLSDMRNTGTNFFNSLDKMHADFISFTIHLEN